MQKNQNLNRNQEANPSQRNEELIFLQKGKIKLKIFDVKKIVSRTRIVKLIRDLKKQGKKIVLAGGCFDILHLGHVTFLENAKKAGDVLILLLESDEAIKKLKGKDRPFNNQKTRAKILSSIEFVDYIILLKKPFTAKNYNEIVEKIAPDIIAATSGDPNIKQKKSQAKKSGGVVKIVLKKMQEFSTTKLLRIL